MKLLLINNLYPPYQRGGAEQVVIDMKSNYQKKGWQVFVMSTKPLTQGLADKEEADVHYLPSAYYELSEKNAAWRLLWQMGNLINFTQTRRIKKILNKIQPDLVITHNLMGLGLLLPRLLKRRKIQHHHFLHDIQLLHPSGLIFVGQEKKIDSLTAKVYQFLTRRLFASPALVLSPSRWLLSEHQRRGFFPRSRTEIKRLKESSGVSMAKKSRSEKKTFIFVGQVEKHKGILLLIEAFKKIGNGQSRLIIVGDGQALDLAKQSASACTAIEFKGRLERNGTQSLIAAADCLIMPSLCYENSPSVIYEAHAAGVAVIAADIGGVPEIITSNDKLFRAGNVNDLADKIKYFQDRF